MVSTASHPAELTLSAQKFRVAQDPPNLLVRLLAGLVNIPLRSDMVTLADAVEYLRDGDARAAVVVETQPPIVAVYSDELDAAILLRIPGTQLIEFDFYYSQRLIAVFNYVQAPYAPRDVTLGEHQMGNFFDAEPFVGDLLSDDVERLEELKQQVSEDEWQRAEQLGTARLNADGLYRWHRPGSTRMIAGDLWKIIVLALFAVLGLVLVLWKFA